MLSNQGQRSNVPQGGYMKRFHDATNDVTDSDRVMVRYNKMKVYASRSNTEEETITGAVLYFFGSFAVAVVIMGMAALFSFIILL